MVTFIENEPPVIGSGLAIDRHDGFTAENVTKTVAGFFAAELLRG